MSLPARNAAGTLRRLSVLAAKRGSPVQNVAAPKSKSFFLPSASGGAAGLRLPRALALPARANPAAPVDRKAITQRDIRVPHR